MSRTYAIIMVCCLLAITIGCYLPGMGEYFLFDDAINITQNPYLTIQKLDFSSLWQASMSGFSGALKRPISMLTFALDYFAWGMTPLYFKYTNLAIHLINGICIYFLSKLLIDACRSLQSTPISDKHIVWISLATSAAWLLHPINLTAVLYVVQRMASLSALFMFLGMIAYLHGRKALNEGRASGFINIILAFLVFTPLAIFSKENGVLLPLIILLMEVVLFKWETKFPRHRQLLFVIFSVLVFLPILAMSIYLICKPDILTATYPIREFTMSERLMTEARVLWFYLRLILIPDLSSFGFYHDDFQISKSLFQPFTTGTSIVGLMLLTIAAILLRKKHALLSFGILFFLIGHSLESSVFALELVYEHRNYFPIFGIVLVLMYYLVIPDIHPTTAKLRRVCAVAFILIFAVSTSIRANHWRDPFEAKLMEVEHHPNSIRANADLASLYGNLPARSQEEAQSNFDLAITHSKKAIDLSDTDTLGLFGLIQTSLKHQVAVDISWWDELARRLSIVPFSPNNANSMIGFKKCYSEGICKFDSALLEKLIRASLNNPTLSGARKSVILFIWADYLYETKHQPEEAEKAAYEGIHANPADITDRIFLITFLDAVGKPRLALDEIEITRKIDRLGTFRSSLDELEGTIRKKIGKSD